jgi:murein DD-endopeptidase MepM/ murein hydrolase activator NlpD
MSFPSFGRPNADGRPQRHPAKPPHDAARNRARAHAGGAAAGTGRGRAIALTIGVAGRQVRIGPVAFWTVVGSLVIMAGWSLVTATYFAFQDDELARMLARQAEMQFAYEDRLAEMRAQVDRVTSRQLLDQEQLEQKLDQITRRQSVLEQRATALGAGDTAATGTVRGGSRPTAGTTPKALPMSGAALSAPPNLREARYETASLPSRTAKPRPADVSALLAGLTESLDRVESRETNTINAMETSYESRARKLRAVLGDVGFDHGKAAESAVGGPFIPYRLAANAGSFDKQMYRINLAHAEVEHLAAVVSTVPLRKPVEGEIDMSSGFGVRIDPFVGRPAMHTGIDFRGETGEDIRVTAAGTVVSAGWSGGYGRMVEVDHGNGFSTRYGHLSEIGVQVGQKLAAGQVIGRMGSTGRSTGPHLHYETRIDGEAVDPHRFLHAGAKFGMM